MAIKINHSKVVTANDSASDAAAGRALKADWNADLIVAASSFASDADITSATDEYLLFKASQIKAAIDAGAAGSGGNAAQTLIYATNITANALLGNIMSLSLTGPCSIDSITNASITKPMKILVTQDATGGRNLIVDNVDFGAGLGGQKLTIVLQYDGTENRLENSPVWS